MTNEEKVQAAIALYEHGKAINKDRTYTLRDITDEEFVLLEKEDKSGSDSGTDSKYNYYRKRFGQFQEMLKVFDVFDEFCKIKPKGTEYTFSERNKSFILMLFREYSGKFENLKRAKVAATDGAYLMAVYNGILDIFYDAGAPDSLIEAVILKMWNRLNIPQRNMDATIDSVCEQCKKMVRKNVAAVSMGMGVREKLLWQSAFRQAFYSFIYRWDQVYENMEQIRKDEMLEKAELEATHASTEWEEFAMIEFEYISEINEAYENDPEIQRLSAERDRMLGVGKKRPPLVRNVEQPFAECSIKIGKRMQEVELQVIRNHIPDYEFPKGCDELPPVDFQFKPLKQLLEEAIEEEQQNREWCQVTSIDDLLNRMKKYFP